MVEVSEVAWNGPLKAISNTESAMDGGPTGSAGSDDARMRRIEYDIVVVDKLREKLFERRNRFSRWSGTRDSKTI